MSLPAAQTKRPWRVLAVLCLAVFAINIDTTIVNVALPSLVRELGTSTRQLQWIVDTYNLLFAALVLAAGSLGDRFGRRGALLSGLGLFGAASGAGALCTTPAQLIAARAVMGVGAALIFPATLSILANVFVQRRARAAAIGIWGATTGIGVALGPITGGWLLEHYWWGSVFVVMVPITVLAAALVIWQVPTSRDPAAPRLDVAGLALSTALVGTVVYTIIEAPDRGWANPATTAGWVVGAVLLVAFVSWERRVPQPMLDVQLFANPRFAAACGAVTVAFFNLFGFIFLISQYFQFMKGYRPLSTGVRFLPVASAVAIGSLLGARLAVRFGTKLIVASGLGLLAVAYAWISTGSAATSYWEIAGQMIVLGSGMGLTSTPATEAILGVVPRAKAGVGSAVNDATRLLGGTMGVAVLGSVFAFLYHRGVGAVDRTGIPDGVVATARDSIGAALKSAGQLASAGAAEPAARLGQAAAAGFFDGLQVACLVAAGISAVAALVTAFVLPAHPGQTSHDEAGSSTAAEPATAAV